LCAIVTPPARNGKGLHSTVNRGKTAVPHLAA
jgi:hypothetical protein